MKFNVSLLALSISGALVTPYALAENSEIDSKVAANSDHETIVVVGELTNFSVTDTELERYQAQDLEDIFRTDPSVSVGGSLGVAQKVYVRGIEDTYLNVTVDGAPQSAGLFHHTGRLTLDPYLLKTVEVQAGAGEATSGAGALGGAIRFKTKSAHDLLNPGEAFGGSVSASYFTNDGYKTSASLFGEINDNWGLLASGVYVDNNNMEDGDGNEISGTASEKKLGFLKVDGNLTDNQTLTLSYENRVEEGDFSKRPNWPVFEDTPLYPHELERHTFTGNHTLGLNDFVNLETTLYYTQAELNRGTNPSVASDPYGGKVKSTGFDLRNTSYISSHSVTYGAEYRADTSSGEAPDGSWAYKEEGDVLGIYVQDHWQATDTILLSFGSRYDKYEMEQKATATKVDSDGFSSNVGFNFNFYDGWVLNAGYAQALRGKQVGDTFALHYTIDSDIKAETAENIEVGLAYEQSNWLASATAFDTKIDDVIDVVGREYQNVGKLKNRGYELKAQYWNDYIMATASFINAEPELNGQTLNGYDHVGLGTARGDTFGLNLVYNVTQDIEIGWNYIYVADLNDVDVINDYVAPGTTIDKPGYQVHDIYAQWYPLSNEDLNINLAVTNLFDEYYRDHSSVGDYSGVPGFDIVSGLYAAGRDIRVGVTYNF